MSKDKKTTDDSAVQLDESELDQVDGSFSLNLQSTFDPNLTNNFLKIDGVDGEADAELYSKFLDHKMGL